MHLFTEIMTETKAMLQEADQKGLFRDQSILEDFAAQVEQLEDLGADLHDEICEARTQFEEHIAALKGLSRAVIQLVGRARYLRSWVATHTAEEKRKKQAERELAANQDHANFSHEVDRESTDIPPAHVDMAAGDLEDARAETVPPAYPSITHSCHCSPCPIHCNTETRPETHPTSPHIPIWRRLWRLSPKPDVETLPECQV